jgi:glycosyltransferase involved in cell wall biosynthesis
MNDNYLITIVIPVYNGQKYLLDTLKSVKNQTYTNFEVLMVDDSSTDESYKILQEFATNDARFKVFKKENGGMVSKTLNYIKPYISGDFYYYLSQDDLISIDLLEKMIFRYEETQADCVLPDMEYYYENENNNKKYIGLFGDRNIELSGKQAFIESLTWNIHGFALFNSAFIKNEIFPEDAFDSDDFITRKWYLESNKVVFSEGTFFYRQDNPNAITKNFSKKNFYMLNSLIRIYNLLKYNNLKKQYIVNSQLDVLASYLKYSAIFDTYLFENANDKIEIKLFLIAFRKQHFSYSFYFENVFYAIKSLKPRLFLFLIIYKVPFLFGFGKKWIKK